MKNQWKKILAILQAFGLLACLCMTPVTASADGQTPLKFGNDGKFKIVIFSDVQDQFPVHQRVLNIMRQAITRENPDLVVFLGDNTEQNIKDPEVDFRRTLNQILAPVVEANVPYAFVFGNHDDQSYYSGQRTDKDAMLAVYQSIGDCRTVDADPSLYGTGTCKIPIYASNSNNIAFDLFMIDSNAYQVPTDTHSGYGSPHADQLAWVAANKDAGVNSLAFQHIPMPEYYNLLVEGTTGTTKTYGGKTYMKQLNANASGTLGEFPNPCPANCNTGEFATLKSMGGVLGVFTGHDHLNDYTGTYDGINLTAVPGMTYFNYGDEAVRGYGVIELDESDLSDYEYHSVKFSTLDAEAGTPAATTYDSYDTVTYADLRKNGAALPESYNIHGSNTFTYTATSPSKSAIFKFRWTAGAETGIQFSFDVGDGGNISHPFGVWVKKPSQANAGVNGAWHLRADKGDSTRVDLSSPIRQGDIFDIELGRLKVLTGDPVHVGQYYVYLKVNDVLIKETYSNTSEDGEYKTGELLRSVSNEIRFGDWSSNDNGNLISAYGVGGDPGQQGGGEQGGEDPESIYYAYDEITYNDLLIDGNPVPSSGIDLSSTRRCTYTATSPTYSAKLKFRWTAGNDPHFVLYYDAWAGSAYPFCLAVKRPNFGDLGAASGANGAWHVDPSVGSHIVQMTSPVSAGDVYDIEFARLKVREGENQDKYHVYLKVDGILISEYYYDGVASNGTYKDGTGTLSNNVIFTSGGENVISAIPVPETYYDYDEVNYSDLRVNGNALDSAGVQIGSSQRCTYNATSPTYSSVLKFRWTASSDPHFVLYYDAWGGSAYPFSLAIKRPGYAGLGAAAGENGAWHIDPSVNSHIVQMTNPIVAGQSYDIEFGRLKVKTGANKDKYYVYLKVDGDLISYYYYDGVASDGTYKNSEGTLSNNVIFTSGGENVISDIPVPETYEDYDEVYYSDLMVNGTPVAEERSGQGTAYTYNKTSASGSAVLKLRWKGANTGTQFQMSFDKKGSDNAINYMFGMQYYGVSAEYPNGYIWLRPGYGPKAELPEPIVAGNNYDIEFARLKVATGPNKGKYYMYFKLNGQLVAEDYVPLGTVDSTGDYTSNPGSTLCTISNQMYITFWGGSSTITNPPFVEAYEDYDEIGYGDLILNDSLLPSTGTTLSGGTVFHYTRTSPTGSAILKYRWKVGSAAKVQMSFEKTSASAMAYQFGAWLSEPGADAGYTNGKMWLRPGTGPQVDMPYQLQPGSSYNVEFARLKVKNGANKGKYYVYIKIDDTLIAETYVEAGVVDSSGDYTTNPKTNDQPTLCNVKSGEIFFAHWGSEGNMMSAYLEPVSGSADTICDFDGNGTLNAVDLAMLTQFLLGSAEMAELPEGIADFNHDGEENILDLIALKKYLAPVNSYAKSGNLVLGMQEHLLEKNGDFTDTTKSAAYIADATATLGAGVYRLSMTPGMIYKANADGSLRVYNNTNRNNLLAMVAALKAKGIDDILYVADSFILPYGYEDATIRHGITVPDPETEPEYYRAWLEVNALGFATVAALCPEIKYFEPFNEINLTTTRMEKSGCAWNSTPEEQAAHKFTVQEKARIMADLCYYISEAVKAVDPANQVTTPSICVGSAATIEGSFLNTLYNTIESGVCPTGKAFGDLRVDNYFTIVNIHNYPEYTDTVAQQQTKVNNAAANMNTLHAVMIAHNDGGSRVWITETGASSLNGNGTTRNLNAGANLINLYLNKINNELTFVDTVIFYKIADISADFGASYVETGFGLFYAGDDLDDPFAAKPIARTVYSFFHNGSTEYSALDAFVARYAG